MKIYYVLFLSLFALNAHTQVNPVVQRSNSSLDRDIRFYSTPNRINGSNYLFDKWENTNSIHFKDGAGKIENININIKDNRFETRISKDSVYVLDMTGAKYVLINNKKYKSFYFPETGEYKIFEIITKTKDMQLLKGFSVFFIKGVASPLHTNPEDKYVVEKKYYIAKETISKIKLNKKSILASFNDRKDEIVNYVKNNRLSYKKEEDVKKIFLFYNRHEF